jgi:hypothetical protein
MFLTTIQELQSITSQDDRLLFTHTVASITGLSRRAVRWNAAHGLLNGFKDQDKPKLWRFRRADVLQFMLRRRRV